MVKETPLVPVSVTAVTIEEADQNIALPAGHAYIVPVKNGKEQPELGFFVSIATADKYYGNKDLYAIKKKN